MANSRIDSRCAVAKRRTRSTAKSMSRRMSAGISRMRRAIASFGTTISPVQPSSFAAYSRTACSPRASMSASISPAIRCALPDSVSGVFAARFRYSMAIGRSPGMRAYRVRSIAASRENMLSNAVGTVRRFVPCLPGDLNVKDAS